MNELREYIRGKLQDFWQRARGVLGDRAFVQWVRWSETGGDCCSLSPRAEHEFVGDACDCKRCGEGRAFYLHQDWERHARERCEREHHDLALKYLAEHGRDLFTECDRGHEQLSPDECDGVHCHRACDEIARAQCRRIFKMRVLS